LNSENIRAKTQLKL